MSASLEPITELLSSISPLTLLWISIKAATILLVTGLLTRYLSGTSATGRHLIWLAALIAVLAAPVASAWLPGLDLHILPTTESWSQNPNSQQSPLGLHRPTSEPSDGATGLDPKPTEQPEIEGSLIPAWTESITGLPWTKSLFAIYLIGLLLQLSFLGVGVARLAWLTQGSRRADPELQALATRLAAALGIRRPVQVRISKRVQGPFVWGVLRPVILVAEDSLKWSPQHQHDALAHELAHVARLDWISLLIGRVACLLYWPLPLGWWAARQMAWEAERACDDQVLLLDGGAADYARQLLDLASRGRVWMVPPASCLLQKSEISKRIRAILDPALRRRKMKKNLYCITLSLGLLAAVAVGAIHIEPYSTPQAKTLLDAAVSGDLSLVRSLLQAGADPNLLVAGERTPLIQAAAAGHLAVVRELLSKGADPNRTDRASSRRFPEIPRSPLGAASLFGDFEIVRLLLQSGAEVELAPRGDGTPLMWAAGAGHEAVAAQLLEAGADPNRIIRGDGTALIAAAGGGHQGVVEQLLDAGADPSLSSRGDGTALYQAIDNGQDSIVELLLDAGADTNHSPRGDATPLARATSHGDTDSVARLLEAGADPNYTPRGDPSALMEAASRGDLEAISMLVERGADPNRPVPGDGDPLIAAARAGQVEAIDLLLDLGARPDSAVKGDGNALIAASANGDLDTTRLLLERGADVNAAVTGDENALINAARRGHIDIAILLLDAGAQVNTQIRDNGRVYSALGEARRMGHSDVVSLLLRSGASR